MNGRVGGDKQMADIAHVRVNVRNRIRTAVAASEQDKRKNYGCSGRQTGAKWRHPGFSEIYHKEQRLFETDYNEFL
jgi:hypothetical protein